MKYLLSTLLIMLSVAAFASSDEAIAYNDNIVKEQTKIGQSIMSFSSSPNDETPTSIARSLRGMNTPGVSNMC